MPKPVRTDILTAHDPLARLQTPEPTTPQAPTAAEPTEPPNRGEATPTTTAKPRRSAMTVDFDPHDYNRIRQAAKAAGLSTRAFIRSAAIARAKAEQGQ